jgi:hypothetical protein
MIYCVVPPELGEEAFRRLSEHYKGNPNVSVIMDRRASERRKNHTGGGERARRDRRRPRAPGTLGV